MDNPVTQFIGKDHDWLINTWLDAQMGPVEMPESVRHEAETAVTIYGLDPTIIEEGPEAAEVARFVLKYSLNGMLDRPVTQKNIDDYIKDMGISFTTADSETASMEEALLLFESRQRSRLGPNEIFISSERYPGLGYAESLARLQQCQTPKQYGTSTFAVSGPDDQGKKADPEIAARYALAYGATLENLPPSSLMISQMDTCGSLKGNEPGFFKRSLKYSGQNGGTSVELCGVALEDAGLSRAIAQDFVRT